MTSGTKLTKMVKVCKVHVWDPGWIIKTSVIRLGLLTNYALYSAYNPGQNKWKIKTTLPPFQWWKKWCILVVGWSSLIQGRVVLFFILFSKIVAKSIALWTGQTVRFSQLEESTSRSNVKCQKNFHVSQLYSQGVVVIHRFLVEERASLLFCIKAWLIAAAVCRLSFAVASRIWLVAKK